VETLVTVAHSAQVFEAVMDKLALPLNVMNLYVFGSAAILPAPIVSGANLSAKSLVWF